MEFCNGEKSWRQSRLQLHLWYRLKFIDTRPIFSGSKLQAAYIMSGIGINSECNVNVDDGLQQQSALYVSHLSHTTGSLTIALNLAAMEL